MKYELIAAATVQELSELVSNKLEEGMKLYGNPSIAIAPIKPNGHVSRCVQAVIDDRPETPNARAL